MAFAQNTLRKEPAHYAGTDRASRVEARPPGIRLGLRKPREVALAPLSASEAALLAEPGSRLKIAVHRHLPPGALDSGAWETTADGKRVWRIALRSPGSEGLRVEFTDFAVGAGKVWLHDGTNTAGPYTGAGIFNNGRFWSATVFSDSVTLEYEPAPDAAAEGPPPFSINTISHRAHPLPSGKAALMDAPAAGRSDPADYCHLDPNCYPDWQPAMSTVGELTFEEDGVGVFCSGSLIATRDNSFKPYLLTAGHCIHSEDAARSLEVYWKYQTSSCTAPPPGSRDAGSKSTLGGHLLASGDLPHGDYSLVLLRDIPGDVTFAGWDISDPPLGTDLTGIHHPKGSWKRISFGERVNDQTVDVAGDLAPGDKYFTILWDKGRTEPGSSGSPLFSAPGVIVGTLTYGPASDTLTACEISPSLGGYGRFSNAYRDIHDYIENLPSAEVLPDRATTAFTVANHIAPPAQTIRLTTQSDGQVGFKLRADAPWIRLSADSGSVSSKSPAPVALSVDPAQFDRPGTYSGTVTILSGSAPPQFVDVAATVRVDQSNVTASISPGVVTQSEGQWSFQIKLAETGGASTRLTAIKVNGEDYTSSILPWFGADRIPANGAIAAPLHGTGLFPSGDQYFEFWGVDDLSGQRWYRVTTVRFQ